jgi:predicted ATP-dependent endonuclease of OLD family
MSQERHRLAQAEEDPEIIQLHLLNQSIEKAEEWLRGQVIRGTSRGESDVNDIYTEIIKNLMIPTESRAKKKYPKEDIIKKLNDIETRNNSYKKYGLTPKFNASVLEDQVRKARGVKLTNVKRILIPYLDSFEAKLNAMQEVQNRISSLVETINSFLVDKHLTFDIRRGFKIISKSTEKLKPEMLSSGERHLLLLFCNTITALDRRCVFIIDEPEISLNMVWQRSLVDSLLNCSKDSPIQYIFASHSAEIISQHLEKVVKLEGK